MLLEALDLDRGQARDRIAERFKKVRTVHEQQRASWRKALDAVRDDSPLDPSWVSHCMDAVKDEDTIVINEYDLMLNQVEFTRPGTFFANSAPPFGLGARGFPGCQTRGQG